MIMTKQQRYALKILEKLGCVRKDQLAALLHARFYPPEKPIPAGFVGALLHQLVLCNIQLSIEDDVVVLAGKETDRCRLEAVDVMLELSQCKPAEFRTESGPVLLRFSVEGKRVSLFAVLQATRLLGADVRAPPVLSSTERAVILLDGKERPPALVIPNPQFYAIRQEDGTHRFFAKEHHET